MRRLCARGGIVSAIIIMAMAALSGCSKETSFTGDIATDYRFKADTLAAIESDWSNRGSSAGSAYLSRRLVAGTVEGPVGGSHYFARTFIWFLSLPDSTADITSAELCLHATRVHGDGACGSFDIHTLADTLYQTVLYWGSMPEPDAEPVADFLPPAEDTGSVVVDVTDIVISWVKNERENLGFAIKGSEIAEDICLMEFASREVPRIEEISNGNTTVYDYRPTLRIAYTDTAGEAQTLESIASADAFADTLISPEGALGEAPSIICGNGFPSRAFIKFDASRVPIEATVTKAVLRLRLDFESSAFDSIGIICHAVVDTAWTGFGTVIGTSGAGLKILRLHDPELGQTAGLDITGLVHPLIARKVRNRGFVVKSAGETSDLDFVGFFGSECPDSSMHPKLEIDYLVPPHPPYSEE